MKNIRSVEIPKNAYKYITNNKSTISYRNNTLYYVEVSRCECSFSFNKRLSLDLNLWVSDSFQAVPQISKHQESFNKCTFYTMSHFHSPLNGTFNNKHFVITVPHWSSFLCHHIICSDHGGKVYSDMFYFKHNNTRTHIKYA